MIHIYKRYASKIIECPKCHNILIEMEAYFGTYRERHLGNDIACHYYCKECNFSWKEKP